MLNVKLTLPHNNLEDTAKDKTGSSEEDSTHDHKRFDEINRVWNSMFCMITEAHGLTSVDYVERDQADPGGAGGQGPGRLGGLLRVRQPHDEVPDRDGLRHEDGLRLGGQW